MIINHLKGRCPVDFGKSLEPTESLQVNTFAFVVVNLNWVQTFVSLVNFPLEHVGFGDLSH